MSENLLIDCGYHKGDFSRDFLSVHPSGWEVAAFDPVPVKGSFQHPAVSFSPVAVWTMDGKIDLFLCTRPDGHSIVPGKNNCGPSMDHRVDCIDFSRWLEENASSRDDVKCKMDIEGAEYAVLDCLLTKGTIKHIKELTVEFHWKRLPHGYRKVHHNLLKRLLKVTVIKPWR